VALNIRIFGPMGPTPELTWLTEILIVTFLVEATGTVRIIVADHVGLLRKIRVSVLSPQMSILLILSPKKYQFLTLRCHFKKNNQIQCTLQKTTWGESGISI
jgi:hypothetical protein